MVVSAVHSQLLRPSGASYAVACLLATPPSSWLSSRGTFVVHIVTARDDSLSVYEVWREGTPTVNGMQRGRDITKGLSSDKYRFYHARTRQLPGSVTGLCKVRTMSSGDDGFDRLLVSFKEAKMTLMEWSAEFADLATISIHTYERAPQLSSGLPHHFSPLLRADREHGSAALLLPNDALAILPLYQDAADLELFETEGIANPETALPYQPSFVVALGDIDRRLGNVRDFAFLHGFQKPTLAILFTEQLTWTSLLHERKDTCTLFLVTLDPAAPSHPVIASRSGLPYDCLYVTACPQSLGGVLVATPSAVMHIAQNGNIIGTTANSWYGLTSKLNLPLREGAGDLDARQATYGPTTYAASRRECLDLQSSHISFTYQSETSALLFLKDGSVCNIEFSLDGRIISKLDLHPLQTSPELQLQAPSTVCTYTDPKGSELVFCGSIVGDSTLAVLVPGEESPSAVNTVRVVKVEAEEEHDIDMDDLYGPSDLLSTVTDKGGHKFDLANMSLAPCDMLTGLGPVAAVALAVLQEQADTVPYFATCTGSSKSGALTLVEPRLTLRKRRKLELSASAFMGAVRDSVTGGQVVITSTGEVSEMCNIGSEGDLVGRRAVNETTIHVGGLIDGAHFVRVYATGMELLTPSGESRTTLRTTTEIRAASTSGSSVVALDDKGSLQWHQVSGASFATIPLCKQLADAHFTSAHLVRDAYNLTSTASSSIAQVNGATHTSQGTAVTAVQIDDDEEIDYGEEDEHAPLPALATASSNLTKKEALLLFVTKGEHAELWSLSERQELLWSSNLISLAPPRLDGIYPEEEVNGLDTVLPVQIRVADISGMLHLCTVYENNLLVAYEAVPSVNSSVTGSGRAVSFVKVYHEQLIPSDSATEEKIPAFLQPLEIHTSRSGVLVGGPVSGLLTKSIKGALHFCFFDIGVTSAYGALATTDDVTKFLYRTADSVYSCEIPVANVDLGLPLYRLASGRTRTEVAVHPPSRSVISSCIFETPFISYEIEDSSPARDPAIDPSNIISYRGAIELFTDREGDPIDGYEFEPNEVASCIELVSLASTTTESRRRDYIAVGTVISYGEDRAARGATYIFDVVEVVAPLNDAVSKHRLKLICKDDCKAPINNIVDMNGYLILTMGMKMYARSLEQDEWLVTIAFLDLYSHTTSVRRLRNYLLLGDFENSLYLVAFQEDPFRLVVLGKDYRPASLTSANFLINGSSLALLGTTLDGVIRALEYAPSVPTSQGGQKLLSRTEYQCAGHASSSMVVSGPPVEPGGPSFRSDIVYGMSNGSIEAVVPVDEATFKVLHLLQTQLMRSVQHFAGLNPRGFRTVRNTSTSRPLTKGILDGALLSRFAGLPFARMADLVRNLPGAADTAYVLAALGSAGLAWGAMR